MSSPAKKPARPEGLGRPPRMGRDILMNVNPKLDLLEADVMFRIAAHREASLKKTADIESGSTRQRTRVRARIAGANSDLADALADEMALGPKVNTSIENLKSEIGELQRETVAYVLDLRSVLTGQQQRVFDEKV